MKLICLIVLLFPFFTFAADEWTYLQREEKVNRFSLDRKGRLSSDGKELDGFELQKTADKVAISTSPSGKLAVLFSIGEVEQCYLGNLEKGAAKQIQLEATPIIWVNWSPESSYVLLASSSGEEVLLFAILFASSQVRKVPVAVAGTAERQELDTGSIEWIDAHTFKMEAIVYRDGSEDVHRIQKLKVDAETLQITAE